MKDKFILIVEDEESLQTVLKAKLSEEGFKVSAVSNGQECLEKIQEDKPDMIILDLIMPVMGGVETLDKLRSDEKTKEIPVLILTNISDMEKVSEVVEKGYFDFLIKTDNTLDQIVEKVKAKLS